MDAQDFAFLVRQAVAVILIKRTTTVFSGINSQRKRTVRSFAGVLNHRLHGKNGPRPNIEGHFIQAGTQLDFLAVFMPCAAPKVVPTAGRKADVFGIHHFAGHRSDKQISAKQKITVVTIEFSCLRIFEKNRAHQGDTRPRGFFDGRIEVRHQTIAQLNIFLANGFVLGSVNPGFLIRGVLGSVIAIDGIERAEFEPARQQIGRRGAGEPADVVTDQRHSGDSHAQKHWCAHLQVIPSAAVVSGPGGSIALGAGKGRASENEGALPGLEFPQALVGGASVFHAVNVVCGAMVNAGAIIKAVDGVERHGLVRAEKDGGLIHVVPEAGDAHGDKILVKAAPPIAYTGQSKIREDAVAGPYFADENRAIGIFHKDVVLDAGVVRPVATVWVFLDVQVGDDNGVKTLSAKIGDHLFERGEVLAIDSEGRITPLVINIEVDDVSGNFLFTKSPDNLADAGLRIIAVAALLLAKRPQWRQGCVPGQGGVLFDDFFWLRAGD